VLLTTRSISFDPPWTSEERAMLIEEVQQIFRCVVPSDISDAELSKQVKDAWTYEATKPY
jgi:hypothetical protein